MSTVEAMRPIPYVINHPKSHPHSLTFFPTQASLVCHICGQIKKFDPTYICTPCVFVIHQGCIGYPHVIRNSRHQHRISFTPSLPPGKLSCRLCHQEVDNDYGAYSCSKCDDDAYVVHTKCALDQRVWDGEDLDGVPEEDDKIDDSGPFERIADGIIRHHSHHSHLLQAEINRVYDENKFCEGCGLPVYEDKYYSCMECDFNLHESCAHAPRMIRHPLHPYPLTLDFVPTDYFTCSVCDRHANGFVYEDYTREKSFRIDLRCASITEPFKYEGHKDPLFLPLETGNYVRCQLCRYNNNYQKLRCMECNYVICLNCATLPYKVKYKHDSHFLTISYGKEESEQQGWCEICEGKIVRQKEEEYDGVNHKDEVEFYYKCNEYCCTTAHVKCLLGEDKDMYVKPRKATNGCITYRRYERRNRTIYSVEFQIILNKSLSRLICGACLRRCPFPTFYKGSVPICSRSCLYNNFNSLTWNFH